GSGGCDPSGTGGSDVTLSALDHLNTARYGSTFSLVTMVIGWDLTAEAIAGIDAGFVVAVVQKDPAAMGGAAVDALVKASA
ncbi:hypothetical protein ACC764_39120, partial [Rhizobium ruizarguesonis]